MLVEGVPRDNLDHLFENLTIVCFNYDRCIEHFLVNWLAAVYSISADEAQHPVREELRILRPYGSIGPLLARGKPSPIAYGAHPGSCDITRLREGIKTYTEQIEDEELISGLKSNVADAEVIVFLGFGFHPQNMKLLTPTQPIQAKRIIASAYETSDANKRSIYDMLRGLGGKTRKQIKGVPIVTIDPNMCGGVLRNNRRDVLAHDLA